MPTLQNGSLEMDAQDINASAAAKLRRRLAEDKGIIVCPGVYDGLTARIALASGFECLYMVNLL